MSTNRPIFPTFMLLTVVAITGASAQWVLNFYERSLRAQFPVQGVIQGNPDANIVFLGDSRVSDWAEHDRLKELYVGFPEATVSQIRSRITDIDWPDSTQTIVVQAGVNDLRILGIRPEERDVRVAATYDDTTRRGIGFSILEVPFKADQEKYDAVSPKTSDMQALVYSPIGDFAARPGEAIYWDLPGGHFTPLGNQIVGSGLAKYLAMSCRGDAGRTTSEK